MPAFFDSFLDTYKVVLHFIAEITINTLEVIGIFIIIIGSFRVIMQTLTRLRKKQPINIMIELGRTLALALEFKMGAEIVNTVIVRDLGELAILAVVIALRAILALLIHWEIKNERRDEAELAEAEKKTDEEEK